MFDIKELTQITVEPLSTVCLPWPSLAWRPFCTCSTPTPTVQGLGRADAHSFCVGRVAPVSLVPSAWVTLRLCSLCLQLVNFATCHGACLQGPWGRDDPSPTASPGASCRDSRPRIGSPQVLLAVADLHPCHTSRNPPPSACPPPLSSSALVASPHPSPRQQAHFHFTYF